MAKVREPEGKRPLGRPRCRRVDNIKMDLRGIAWDGVDWIDLAQGRDQWTQQQTFRFHKILGSS
jgi:hypothetical protein